MRRTFEHRGEVLSLCHGILGRSGGSVSDGYLGNPFYRCTYFLLYRHLAAKQAMADPIFDFRLRPSLARKAIALTDMET